MEFEIVTSDQRRLAFIANSMQERDDWVSAIGRQIGNALVAQQAESKDGRPMASKAQTDEIFEVAGNNRCADCGASATRPSWAVYNYGIVICIECSGV